jgi:hypothetical protein
MFDIDEVVRGAADDWFMHAAEDVAYHHESDDVAFDRWLAALPEGGLDEALNTLLDSDLSATPNRGPRRSASPWRC